MNVSLQVPSNTERAVRNREYSRRHRAKRNCERNELKVLKEEALPKFCKVTQEAISTLEKDQDIPKALQNLHRLQSLLCHYLAEPSGSSSHHLSPPASATQIQQSDLSTTPSLQETVMDSQNPEYNSLEPLSRSLYDPYDTTPSNSDLDLPAELIDVVSMFVSHQTDQTVFPPNLYQ